MRHLIIFLLFCTHFAHAEPDSIYLFRHSEKEKGPNPHLTHAGKQRASQLSSLIEGSKPVTLYSTDYNRTLETANALAKDLGVKVQVYNPRELVQFTQDILIQSGTIIIVGHSNTSVELAALFSELAVDKMAESEFSRYFLLQRTGQNYHLSDLQMTFE
ncbi:histidine phosphatase family protein [Pseudoalteromonas sp. H105]|uniref:histidine phosphatase family protein n=1 Tax=Pseudoalteromonas sp. H105 TaxID=1348393 RepID=UPI0007322004|nr:histidine phosphatase family protein [Pseudoalteromonas sp. H105]KTF16240.1 hypothetical protein ATS75_07545 [Pseudoalteromonas sp. H105]